MKNTRFLVFIFLVSTCSVFAQEHNEKYLELGIEAQQYPTGFLLGGRAELGLSAHHAIELRLGYNLLDHKDFGEHDSEIGGGLGFTLGYRYYLNADNQKWFGGVRADLWFNEIDWEDLATDILPASQGTTNVKVLQPTAIVGYRWGINDHFAISPTLAVGAEINIKTDGEAVGQGAIILWGINLTYRL